MSPANTAARNQADADAAHEIEPLMGKIDEKKHGNQAGTRADAALAAKGGPTENGAKTDAESATNPDVEAGPDPAGSPPEAKSKSSSWVVYLPLMISLWLCIFNSGPKASLSGGKAGCPAQPEPLHPVIKWELTPAEQARSTELLQQAVVSTAEHKSMGGSAEEHGWKC
jgi:hypothetical protein